MLRNKFFILFISVLLIGACKNKEFKNKYIILNDGWRFKLGDSIKWANVNYNDINWNKFNFANVARNDTFKTYDGYGWYRIKFFIPSILKSNAYTKEYFKISLGAIDDCDQVYLNGNMIGENTITVSRNYKPDNNFEKAPGLWDKNRTYILAAEDTRILWDRKNTLSVRIYDQGGNGGLTTQVPTISMCGLEDYISIDTSRFYKEGPNGFLRREVIIKNTLKTTLNGGLSIAAVNTETKQSVYNSSVQVSVSSMGSEIIQIKLPVSTDPTIVIFKLKDNASNYVVNKTETIPYVLADIKYKNAN